MVAQNLLNVTLYAHSLSCYIITKHGRPGSILTGTDWNLVNGILFLVGK